MQALKVSRKNDSVADDGRKAYHLQTVPPKLGIV